MADTNNQQQAPVKSEIALREEEVLAFWNRENIFEKSVAKDAPKGTFVFNDGPPFATGTPHYGHLVASAMKDAIPRYFTMRGYHVSRQWGWDCHGLPIENIVEKNLGSTGKKDIEKLGVKVFNDKCREQIFTYVDVWNEFIPRFGRWADMAKPYKTMDKDFMESEWWAFKTLYDKGLIYEDYRTMHVCPRCETTLAQSEVAEGYKTVKDLAVTVAFQQKNDPSTVFLAWTTTPWTLPGNVALAVGKDVVYLKVTIPEGFDSKEFDLKDTFTPGTYIFAEESGKRGGDKLHQLFWLASLQHVPSQKVLGKDLLGIEYVPPFSSYLDKEFKNKENAWKVYHADFITADSGTGIAHEAPAFGAEDMALAQDVGLPIIHHLEMNGVIQPEVVELAGLNVKPHGADANGKDVDVQSTDVAVIKYLAAKGLLFSKEKYEHSYPHCWRCDTPLINYATSSWFVAVQKLKEGTDEETQPLFANAKDITWSPAHIKNGRWGEWLKGAKDWSISRQRFWANTIPVWTCATCRAQRVFGSAAELEAVSGVVVNDLHKDVVDEVVVPCGCGGSMRRVPDVLDTWFNSGSVPFATHHYLGTKGGDAPAFTADFIAEGQDQVSKWFYYQHVLSVALFNKPAFKSVLVNGIVLAEDGKKMSKRLKNYPDPQKVIDTYGADAVRLYILSSPVVKADNLNFSEAGVAELSRKVIGRLVEVYKFYAQYAEMYKESLGDVPATNASSNVLDKWIVARLHDMHSGITTAYNAYDLNGATRPLTDFVDDLSTWYLRRSRDRIKDGGNGAADALATMRYIFAEFAKLAAPSMPFVADWLWQKVKREGDVESVHLAAWVEPKPESLEFRSLQLLAMQQTRAIASAGLEVRAKQNIKVRQPLHKVELSQNDYEETVTEQYQDILKDELNVKEISFVKTYSESFITATLKSPTTDIPILAIDPFVTSDLKREGDFRDLLRSVQELRKNTGLNPGEKATLAIPAIHKDTVEPFMAELKKVANLTGVTFGESEMILVKV